MGSAKFVTCESITFRMSNGTEKTIKGEMAQYAFELLRDRQRFVQAVDHGLAAIERTLKAAVVPR